MAKVRINAELSPAIAQQLSDLAAVRGTTMSEVLRQAIATEAYIQACVDGGEKIFVGQKGAVREIVFAR